ncbi:PREDICTED: uncharacterized protein LOC106817896 [Priapulus caudatus]|uniref:Uncharacterized protein LOC106817896 n=1 Tax=Priapulus caudatus TaxID=37621 RepID=A0ABM1F0X2_PRICU|nr:PREDICTED: uncharacterized protein LOC106817896 [Priapulus caudatus]
MYQEFQVYKIKQGNYDDEEEQTLEKTLKLALIIVCIILPVIVITLICIWCSEVNKYKRKLRAANAMAFGSRESGLNRVCVPNTNQYAYEGSNPIWMEQYDHVYANNVKEDEDDTNSQNSLDENLVDGSNQHISVISKSQYDKTPLNGLEPSHTARNDLNKRQLKQKQKQQQQQPTDHEYEEPDKLKQSKLPTTDI